MFSSLSAIPLTKERSTFKVVAGGVETNEQMDRLRELGCEYGQGYLFSKPVAAETARVLLINALHWQPRILSIKEAHSLGVLKLPDVTYSM
jgi:sensor c-di-GMP phosphodiesterase-like protein